MPLTTANPALDDDRYHYPYLMASLAISPRVQGQSIGASVSIKLVPYRIDEQGNIVEHSSKRAFVTADAFAAMEHDPVLAEAVVEIMTSLQKFITLKNM